MGMRMNWEGAGASEIRATTTMVLQRVTLFGRWPHPSSFQGAVAGVGGWERPARCHHMIQAGRWAQCYFMILHQVLIPFNNMVTRCNQIIWRVWYVNFLTSILKTESFPSLLFTARVNAHSLAQPATMVLIGLTVGTTMGCCWARIRSFDDTARLRHVLLVSFRPETTINQEIEMMKTLSSLPQILGMTTKTMLYYSLLWYDVIWYDVTGYDGFLQHLFFW